MSRIVIACVALVATLAPLNAFSQEVVCPTVTAAYNEASKAKEVRLGDVIKLEVTHLPALYTEACGGGDGRAPVLYLEGLPLVDHVAKPSSDPADEALFFTLERSEDSRDVWTVLLGEPTLSARPVDVSVGYPDRYPVRSNATVNLLAVAGGWFVFWVVIFVVMVVAFFFVTTRSNVLRADPIDFGPNEASGRGPYSLARVQAAWWFFLIMAAYLLIGIVTGDFLTSINTTALGLLGIGAATVIGAAVIDSSKAEPTQTPAAALAQAQADLAAATTPAGIAAANKRIADIKKTSENLLMDIISDANGVVFHRFQSAAWTLVLGIVFVVEVYKNLGMPEFDATLLGLQGLSVATYLGLKIPEQDTPS